MANRCEAIARFKWLASMVSDADRHRLTEAQHQEIFEKRIAPLVLGGLTADPAPVAIVFGGQPGAGKSPAIDAAARAHASPHGIVQVLGDDLRAFHPKYAALMAADDRTAAAYTDRDAGAWVAKLIGAAQARRLNLIVEGTMRRPEVVENTLQALRDAGYRTEARVLAVPPELSWLGVLQRYEAQREDRGYGRMTLRAAHDAAVEGLPRSVESIESKGLADRLLVLRRGDQVLHENQWQSHAQGWSNPTQGAQLVVRELTRPLSLQERQDYLAGLEAVAAQQRPSERGASTREPGSVEALMKAARDGLAAAAFRDLPEAEAIKLVPALSRSYEVLKEIDRRSAAEGFSAAQRETWVTFSKSLLAGRIERGDAEPLTVWPEMRRDRDAAGPER
jgi:Zeta toxin